MILGEKLEREENLEKKRKFSKYRKKSQKKRIFSGEIFFPEKSLFSKRKFSFHTFLSKYSWKRVIKHENGSIGCVRTIRIHQKSRKSIRSGQKLKKRIFSGKKSLLKKFSFFLKFFSFSRDFSLFLWIFVSFLFFSRNEIHLFFQKRFFPEKILFSVSVFF